MTSETNEIDDVSGDLVLPRALGRLAETKILSFAQHCSVLDEREGCYVYHTEQPAGIAVAYMAMVLY